MSIPAPPRIKLPGLVYDRDRHGNVRVYVRQKGKTGEKVRIRSTPGTPEFFEDYQAAYEGRVVTQAKLQRATQGSLRWLCVQYFDSVEFRQLGPTTARRRRAILEAICQSKTKKGVTERGDLPHARMLDRHIYEIRDERADYPESANGYLKALRQLFKWAIKKGHALKDPAASVEQLRSQSTGFHTWTEEEVARYEARHPIGTKARLAFGLLRYTGVRRSDVVKLGRAMEKDGTLTFTVSKGATRRGRPGETAPGPKRLSLPILHPLRAILDASPSGHLTYLVTEFQKPFTANGFGNKFRDWCREAGLPHCSAHGIRKHAAVTAAENGATELQLMAMFGWDNPQQAALYTRKANRSKLAKDAMHLIAPTTENKKG